MADLVSILIPAYNADKWIADAIRCAIGQHWQKKEVVIVNDGSTDNTLRIAQAFQSQFVKVVTQDRHGASAARNKALSLAQGDYIQWLDADDLLAPDKISRQMAIAEADPGALQLFSAAFGVFHYRVERAKFKRTGIWQDLAPIDWILKNFSEHAWMFPGAWLISRRLTELAGPWNEGLSLNDDGEYICRVVLASERVRFVESALCYYRNSGYAQLSKDTSEAGLRSLLLSLKLCIDHLTSFEDSERTRKACVTMLQLYLPYFHPVRTTMLDEIDALALDLGSQLSPPCRNWKSKVLRALLGEGLSDRTVSISRKASLAVAVKWDQILYEAGASSTASPGLADSAPRSAPRTSNNRVDHGESAVRAAEKGIRNK